MNVQSHLLQIWQVVCRERREDSRSEYLFKILNTPSHMLPVTSISFFLRYAMNSRSVSVRQGDLRRRGGKCAGVLVFPSGGMFKDVNFLKICSAGVLWENILLPYAELLFHGQLKKFQRQESVRSWGPLVNHTTVRICSAFVLVFQRSYCWRDVEPARPQLLKKCTLVLGALEKSSDMFIQSMQTRGACINHRINEPLQKLWP